MGNLGGTPKSAHLWGLGAACFSSALVPFVVPSMLPAPPFRCPPPPWLPKHPPSHHTAGNWGHGSVKVSGQF